MIDVTLVAHLSEIVSLQTALAKCVLKARTRLTLDQPPIYPYIAGPLALPDPPSRLYPDHQLPRHDAVPSLSRRPLLFFCMIQ